MMKMMEKIAVCIPTFREEDTIAAITRKIDSGICKIGWNDAIIVNCNNQSGDKTGETFLLTETKNRKVYLENKHKGKGYNLLEFFE